MSKITVTGLLILALACWTLAAASAQLSDSLIGPEHPAIAYGERAATDPVAQLNQRLATGQASLRFEAQGGYLRSLLEALRIPVDSQIAVFSKTSLQGHLVSPRNPRTIFFNDSVAVAWMRGGFIEVAAHDVEQGAVFYVLPQVASPQVQLRRDAQCIQCHFSATTLGVPGFMARSVATGVTGMAMPWLGSYIIDHRSRFEDRWGGWYVTGRAGAGHLGNAPIADPETKALTPSSPDVSLATLAGRFDTGAYLTPHSDLVALMVFEHQMHMMNLLTRIGWEARAMAHERRPAAEAAATLRRAAIEVVDYLLFVDEAPLKDVRGTSGFAERFSAVGPRDRKGRSLRELELRTRVLKYRCSYMIYSPVFDALPADATNAIYRRLWQVLSGEDRDAKYARLPAAERQAILEILRDTKALPDYFSRQ